MTMFEGYTKVIPRWVKGSEELLQLNRRRLPKHTTCVFIPPNTAVGFFFVRVFSSGTAELLKPLFVHRANSSGGSWVGRYRQ